jgi:effector-binding domain-containing protein
MIQRLSLAASLFLFACSNAPTEEPSKKPADTTSLRSVEKMFDVPEMLVMSVLDSASASALGDSIGRDYALLEQEMKRNAAVREGPLGRITYGTDSSNIVFEAIALIKGIPPRRPDHAVVRKLPGGKMLIYDHYGPYTELYKGYARLQEIMERDSLLPGGPVREFFIVSPDITSDPSKFQTRLMLPVTANTGKGKRPLK